MATCERISEAYLLPVLQDLMDQFPFEILGVAKSGYQAWYANKIVPLRTLRQQEEAKLVAAIKAAHLQGRGVYGA